MSDPTNTSGSTRTSLVKSIKEPSSTKPAVLPILFTTANAVLIATMVADPLIISFYWRRRMAEIKQAIDQLSRETGYGEMSTAYTNMLYGINHRGLGNPVAANRDNSGITFITRPNLNLTYDNIQVSRKLVPLGTFNHRTIQRAIRTTLDPESARVRNVTCPMVNHKSPFIALLTNNLLTMDGWPDIAPQTYASKEGIYGQSWAMYDGVYNINQVWDLTANFRNIAGDPITALFNAWIEYGINVKLGTMVPYPISIVENEIDTDCAIYRFVLDPTRRFVQKFAKTICFPVSSPMGATFNFTGEQTFVQATEQINIQFRCMGADYNDPIIIDEFNRLVESFEPGLKITKATQAKLEVAGRFYQLRPEQLRESNYFGIPLINPFTYELCWFVNADELDYLKLGN